MEPAHWTRAEVQQAKDTCTNFTSFNSKLTCGPCVVPTDSDSRVIFLSAVKQENSELLAVELALKERWAVSVMIHVADEYSALGIHTVEDVAAWNDKLTSLYQGVGHVFRTYPVGHAKTDKVHVIPVGWNSGFFGAYGDGLQERETKDKTYLWAFAGTMSYRFLQFSQQRHAMHSHMSALSPFAFHNADEAKLPKQEMKHMYETARFVGSPRGDSLDGFRHYEATLTGAVPILETHHSHADWPWSEHGIRPLGWLFPSQSVTNSISEFKQCAQEPSAVDQEWLQLQLFSSWAELARRVQYIGDEELALRAEVSIAWYETIVEDIQKRIAAALG